MMTPKVGPVAAGRPCPECGAFMQYKPKLLTRLTGRYYRACTKCSYSDPEEVDRPGAPVALVRPDPLTDLPTLEALP